MISLKKSNSHEIFPQDAVYDPIQSPSMPEPGWRLACYDLEVLFCIVIAENTTDRLKCGCWHPSSNLRKAIVDCREAVIKMYEYPCNAAPPPIFGLLGRELEKLLLGLKWRFAC